MLKYMIFATIELLQKQKSSECMWNHNFESRTFTETVWVHGGGDDHEVDLMFSIVKNMFNAVIACFDDKS